MWWCASLVAQMPKNLPAMQGTWVRYLDWEDPLEKGVATHSSMLAGESHGPRSLVGYKLWSRKELDTTERLSPKQWWCRQRSEWRYCWLWRWKEAMSQGMWAASGSWKRQGKRLSSRAFRKGYRPPDVLILAWWDPCWMSNLQNCIANVWVFLKFI